MVSQCCFNLYFLDDVQTWSIFSYAYLPAVCLLWWCVKSWIHFLNQVVHFLLLLRFLNFDESLYQLCLFMRFLPVCGSAFILFHDIVLLNFLIEV